jgi:Cof subfamily protein (haloacid dehalogenase superfamily)
MADVPVHQYKAVALDVDGTITDSTHQVRPRAIEAIKWLESEGIPVVILTGRRPKPVLELAEVCGLARPMVTDNGGTIVHTGTHEVMAQHFASPDIVDTIFGLAERFGLGTVMWTPDNIYVEQLTEFSDTLSAMAGDQVVHIDSLGMLPKDRVLKMNLYGSEEELDAVQPYINAHHPEVRRSAKIVFETATPGATKWEGLLYCLDHLGLSSEQTVGVADGENDLDFIAQVGLGVAVENAYPRLKDVAKLVIGRADQDATADFLEGLFGRTVRA